MAACVQQKTYLFSVDRTRPEQKFEGTERVLKVFVSGRYVWSGNTRRRLKLQ